MTCIQRLGLASYAIKLSAQLHSFKPMGLAYDSTSCMNALMIRGVKPHKRMDTDSQDHRDKAHADIHSDTDKTNIKLFINY